jgi:sulfonate transport system permease protein
MSDLLLKQVLSDASPDASSDKQHQPVRWVGWRLISKFRYLILPLLILIVWESLGRFDVIDPVLMPKPTEVLAEIAGLFASGEIWSHFYISLFRVFAGFSIGVTVAILLGALTGFSPFWRSIIDPTIHALRTIPGLAWIPMFILWLGIDESSKIVLIAKATFFPTYLNFMSGIIRADKKLIEVGQIYRLQGSLLVRKVLIPYSLPYLFVGLRQSMGVAWLVLVAAEMMGASSGLGYLLLNGEMTGRPQVVMACMLIFALCGKTSDYFITLISRRVLHWQDTVEKD